jgi:hypothetical protein
MELKKIQIKINDKPTTAATAATDPTKKIITTKRIWDCICDEDLLEENQKKIADTAAAAAADSAPLDKKTALIHTLVKQKIYSYKSQDLAKNKYCESEFISLKDVFDLFLENQLICHYCEKQVMILYENIREPRQWSLDRIDNTRGHNRGNLFLSCLSCNLRRRCMYHERYKFTKSCAIVKKID